jgi:hypothetical protein
MTTDLATLEHLERVAVAHSLEVVHGIRGTRSVYGLRERYADGRCGMCGDFMPIEKLEEALAHLLATADSRCPSCGELLGMNYHDADGNCIHQPL